MSTTIQWTDETWNPVTGCTKVSEGCRNCYIERSLWRQKQDPWTVVLHPDRLMTPLKWKSPKRIFMSLADLFHEDVPDEFILACFRIMKRANQHTYQVLTKRPERMLSFMRRLGQEDGELFLDHLMGGMRPAIDHIWLGVSIENQATADERIQILLQTPAAVRFISAEPLLGPICLDGIIGLYSKREPTIHWVIVGGESGPGARPCNLQWIRSIRDQCQEAGVPVFVKQLGAYAILDSRYDRSLPGYRKLRDKKGGDWNEWPEDLKVREWPR